MQLQDEILGTYTAAAAAADVLEDDQPGVECFRSCVMPCIKHFGCLKRSASAARGSAYVEGIMATP